MKWVVVSFLFHIYPSWWLLLLLHAVIFHYFILSSISLPFQKASLYLRYTFSLCWFIGYHSFKTFSAPVWTWLPVKAWTKELTLIGGPILRASHALNHSDWVYTLAYIGSSFIDVPTRPIEHRVSNVNDNRPGKPKQLLSTVVYLRHTCLADCISALFFTPSRTK